MKTDVPFLREHKGITMDTSTLRAMLETARKDPHAELEVKVLAGMIQTPDVANRIRKAIRARAVGEVRDTHQLRQSYPDGRRVEVEGAEVIHKVCTSGSFRNLPLTLQKKRRYFEHSGAQQDTLDVPDQFVRFTLRHEEILRKDFGGTPGDPAAQLRILHRQSWRSVEGHWQFDLTTVKSRDPKKSSQSIPEVLKNPPTQELEIELLGRDVPAEKLVESLTAHIQAMVSAQQGSKFILSASDQTRYRKEWDASGIHFINVVTLERRHIRAERPGNILKDYTVTNKADGERSILFVARDKRLLKINNSLQIAWTGIVALQDDHIGTAIDGEFLPNFNKFCIFDVYRYKGKDIRGLPLLRRDTDPLNTSRLGHAKLFVEDLRTQFVATGGETPQIETKLFLAGNGAAMEAAISRILNTEFEQPTDGLIFTPRNSPLAPLSERRGDTWLRVYKWKPPHQNSIDFLLRVDEGTAQDPVLRKQARKGTLQVSRTASTDLVYPCQQLTGEYVPPELPPDLARLAEIRDRVPSPFQPSAPRKVDAQVVYIPVNARGVMQDIEEERVEDNTIIECSQDVENMRWQVMRTRQDKTQKYRVLKEAQYGNDAAVADNIWTSIHVPVTESMLTHLTSNPPDDTQEDELYYRDNLDSRDRILKDVYGFHNRIKDGLYKECVLPGSTLLELAVGRAGDLYKWIHAKPSRVVGLDLNESNLNAPRQGACSRVLKERAKGTQVPPVLFIPADMTQPLAENNHPYFKILRGEEPGPTPYLQQFSGLKDQDAVSCQFAIHQACNSEDTFRTFVQNITGDVFFGTCLDGQAVYSMLLGQNSKVLRSRGKVYGEFTKEYKDGEGWQNEFGMGVRVLLESFEVPSQEFLVPFDKVTEILGESGFSLVHTEMFSELYSQQTEVRLSPEQQTFCFLHRSFVFRRSGGKPEPVEEVTVPVMEAVEEKPVEEKPAEEEKPVVVVKKATRKLKPKPEPEGPPPVFFLTADESKGDPRVFSNEQVMATLIDGIKQPTVEHQMVAQKARQFGDEIAFQKVMKAKTAKSAKGVEKSIKDVKEEEWEARQEEVMRTALRAKFTQHPELRAKLLDTGDRPFAQANPRDKYWSIGTSEDTDKAKNPAKWPGKNRLGVLLGELRTTLRGEAA